MFALKENIASRAGACATEVCWRQWRSLAAVGLPIGQQPTESIVDPEALVLLSLAVRHYERRLDDRLSWWAARGSSLMSVQRMRTLVAGFPERVRQQVAWFAAMALAAGDHRWKVLADGKNEASGGRPGKAPHELQLLEPSTLMVRLRAGFGVGAKADLLAFLIGAASALNERSVGATAEVIAKAISYSVASTRRAATEMALARFVSVSADRPVQYFVDVKAWAQLLQLRPVKAMHGETSRPNEALALPPWRFWAQMFPFLAACVELGEDDKLAKAAPVVQASRLRDLAESFRRPLGWNGIAWIDPRLFPGERYFEAFGQMLDAVIAWIEAKA